MRISQWGIEDPDVLNVLRCMSISGTWLNLAVGDGRYNTYLLSQADQVIAVDINKETLQSLETYTSNGFKRKLTTTVCDLRKKLVWSDNSFDGVFCTGTLHLFSSETLFPLFQEVKRVLRPEGVFVFDFSYDIQRVLSNGELYIHDGEPQYNRATALQFLPELLDGWMFEYIESSVPRQDVEEDDKKYQFSCLYTVVVAYKKKNK